MGGLFSHRDPPPPPPLPPPAPPAPMPNPNSPQALEARKKKIAMMQSRSGRSSTILSDNGDDSNNSLGSS